MIFRKIYTLILIDLSLVPRPSYVLGNKMGGELEREGVSGR